MVFLSSYNKFCGNKLTYKELYDNLPIQIINAESGTEDNVIYFYAAFQDPDPVYNLLVDEKTGLSVEGMIQPDSRMEIEKMYKIHMIII